MAKGGFTQRWLDTVPLEAKVEIKRIQAEVSPLTRNARGGEMWWVRLSPTCRTASDVTLICRGPDGVVTFQREIMRNGVMCA